MGRFPVLRRAVLLTATSAATAALVLNMSPLTAAEPTSPPVRTTPDSVPGRYIVTLAQQPVATYDGNVRGLAATRPSSGRKFYVPTGLVATIAAFINTVAGRALLDFRDRVAFPDLHG